VLSTSSGNIAHSGDGVFGDVKASSDLLALLPDADYVIVAAPLTEESRGMFDAAALGRMKLSARLINIGRGPIVVEEDLARALQEKRIAGAALDVFSEEPRPHDHRLWAVPNLLISPHMSGDFGGWRDALVALFVENFQRWRADETLINIVDKSWDTSADAEHRITGFPAMPCVRKVSAGSGQLPLNVIGDVACVVADAEENSRLEGVHPMQPKDVKAL